LSDYTFYHDRLVNKPLVGLDKIDA